MFMMTCLSRLRPTRNRNRALTETMPHLTGTKILLQTCVGQTLFEVYRPAVVLIAGSHSVRSLVMDYIGNGPGFVERSAAVIVVLVAGKVEIHLILEVGKLL
jgi:hypothetical protein